MQISQLDERDCDFVQLTALLELERPKDAGHRKRKLDKWVQCVVCSAEMKVFFIRKRTDVVTDVSYVVSSSVMVIWMKSGLLASQLVQFFNP